MAESNTIYSTPGISVVILNYNFEEYIEECVQSVLAQTLRPFEIIICDDHSTDGSWEIIKRYSMQYPELIKAYRHEQNLGAGANGSFGMKQARGNLLTWMDGDDRCLPQKLELEWKTLRENPEAKMAYSNVRFIDSDGNRKGLLYDGTGPPPPDGSILATVLSRRFSEKTRGIMRNNLRYRHIMDKAGYFDLELSGGWDWDEAIRLTARFPVVYTGEALFEYRIHPGGYTQRSLAKRYESVVAVYEKNLSLLNNLPLREALRVRCFVENPMAGIVYSQMFDRRKSVFTSPERLSYYSAPSVYDRNCKLYDQLPRADRQALSEELAPLFKLLAIQIISGASERGDKKLAFKYLAGSLWRYPSSFDIKLIARLLLPKIFYKGLRKIYYIICGGKAGTPRQ